MALIGMGGGGWRRPVSWGTGAPARENAVGGPSLLLARWEIG